MRPLARTGSGASFLRRVGGAGSSKSMGSHATSHATPCPNSSPMSPTSSGMSRPKLRTFKAFTVLTMATVSGSSRLTMAMRAIVKMRALAAA
ncbi:hypothetical protein D3C73_1092680 [compost metagenome]